MGGGSGLFTARRFRKEFSQLLLNNIYLFFFFNTFHKECGKMFYKNHFFSLNHHSGMHTSLRKTHCSVAVIVVYTSKAYPADGNRSELKVETFIL